MKQTYSLGYIPSSFPRDPIAVNQFTEHMLLGQILEPLVESDRAGNVESCIAKSWVIDSDAKRIVFQIAECYFSNGNKVTAKDVAYSIGRHLGSKSQSAVFLADIEKIASNNRDEVVIELKKPNVAVLVSLSRDQLGILPDGWVFDEKSDEPYIGTGSYRLIRESGQWTLVANTRHKNLKALSIRKWLLCKPEDVQNGIAADDIPDYVPAIAQPALDEIRKRPTYKSENLEERELVSFLQTSFWIYPTSTLFEDELARKNFASAFGEVVEQFAKTKYLARATGLFPLGIGGHNKTRTKVTIASGTSVKILKLAYMKGAFDQFVGSELFNKFLFDNGMTVELIPWEPTMMSSLKEKEIDVVTGSWAGGFNDPTGFLALPPLLLGIDFKTYLGQVISADLIDAQAESEKQTRVEKFAKFDRMLVEAGLLIPGWRSPMFSVLKKPLRFEAKQSRYTERLINITDN